MQSCSAPKQVSSGRFTNACCEKATNLMEVLMKGL